MKALAAPSRVPTRFLLDAVGDFAFTTSTPLVSADQNTARSGQDPSRGDDLYEWRDGRLLLVTDGTSDNSRPIRWVQPRWSGSLFRSVRSADSGCAGC